MQADLRSHIHIEAWLYSKGRGGPHHWRADAGVPESAVGRAARGTLSTASRGLCACICWSVVAAHRDAHDGKIAGHGLRSVHVAVGAGRDPRYGESRVVRHGRGRHTRLLFATHHRGKYPVVGDRRPWGPRRPFGVFSSRLELPRRLQGLREAVRRE